MENYQQDAFISRSVIFLSFFCLLCGIAILPVRWFCLQPPAIFSNFDTIANLNIILATFYRWFVLFKVVKLELLCSSRKYKLIWQNRCFRREMCHRNFLTECSMFQARGFYLFANGSYFHQFVNIRIKNGYEYVSYITLTLTHTSYIHRHKKNKNHWRLKICSHSQLDCIVLPLAS